MYKKWLQYGEVEVANAQRVYRYVENGLTPVGAVVQDCDECEDLAEALGEGEYRTPILDHPAWFSQADPDSGDFAGVLVVEITGLSGSTATVDVQDRLGDGGVAGARRSTPRTIQVTADMVGRTPEATESGIEWLSSALHPPCAAGSDCSGDVLHLFSACPPVCEGLTDPDGGIIHDITTLPAEFDTSGSKSTNPAVVNRALNPSGESATVTWSSPTFSGAYVAGAVAVAAPPVALSRAQAWRLTTPAMSAGQKTNASQQFTPAVTGVHEFSQWVYVPAATVTRVRAVVLGGNVGPYVGVKDKWVRVSVVFSGVAATPVTVGIETDTTQVPATSSLIWSDAGMFRSEGGFSGAGSNGSSNYQDPSSSAVEGWHGNTVFGTVTVPQTIQTEAFTGPGPALLPRSLHVVWKAALDPGSLAHSAFNILTGLTLNRVYTVECDVYVPVGSPDISVDLLFTGAGETITAKGSWVRVRTTFTTRLSTQYYGFTTPTTGSAGLGFYLNNLRVFPGFGTLQPLTEFDGAKADLPNSNLAAGVVPTASVGTLTPGVVRNGSVWYQFDTTVGSDSAQVAVLLASLTSGEAYQASWMVFNPMSIPVTLRVDWCDEPYQQYVIQPLETRRLYARGARAYDATYRFTELWVDVNSVLLFRDVEVYPVSPYDFAWTGAAELSTSTATPLGDQFVFRPDAGDATLLGPVYHGACHTVVVEWVVFSPTGATTPVTLILTNTGGNVLQTGQTFQVGSTPQHLRWVLDVTPEYPDDWRPGLVTSLTARQVAVQSLTASYQEELTLEQCVEPYRRTFRNVVTVAGPTVVEERTLGDLTDGSTVTRVEWTWVALSPDAWHDPADILLGVQGKGAGAAAYNAPGVPLTAAAAVTVASTACARPATTALTCADNTLGSGVVLPPQAPVIADPNVMTQTGNYTRRIFEIPATLTPAGVGKLSWTFVNDAKPKFGVRVRVYEDIDPAFPGVVAECSFVEEFTIEYLAASQTLFVDGPADDVYVQCGVDVYGDPIYADSLKNVRGSYGGPFANSLVGCGKVYYISVDVPNVYNNPTLTGFANGTSQGDLVWSVDLTRRA